MLIDELWPQISEKRDDGSLPLNASFLLAISTPMINLPIERIWKPQMGSAVGHLNDGVLGTRLAKAMRKTIGEQAVSQAADLGIEPLAPGPDGNAILSLQKWTIRASAPERAILEALDELPDNESFHNIDTIFEGLTNLRPRRMTELLADCTKVHAKRLFFVFADRHEHAWLKHVDRSIIDLGSGDRSFIKGGKLHPTYRITIPEEYLPGKPEGKHGP